ncbi:MAG TPA: hypothetical protein VF669_01600 [Tepidisphaeraceae bacterium]|jgi:hypothetical protein
MSKIVLSILRSRARVWAVLILCIGSAAGWAKYQIHLREKQSAALQEAAQSTASRQELLRRRLIGDWISGDVPSAIGPLKIEMKLREVGSCHVNIWTNGAVKAQIRDKEGSYELNEDRICSELLKRGSCRYWFEGGNLMLEYKDGVIVTFAKQEPAQTAAAVAQAKGFAKSVTPASGESPH